MGSQVVARMQGDDFQMRYFWLRVLDLITSDYVASVELESRLVNVVDDVVVHYKPPGTRDAGGFFETDCCQLKYHVTHAGTFSTDALLDPQFTHTKEPFLRRLYNAFLKLKGRAQPFRLRVVSSWGWDASDPLAGHLATEGHLRDSFFSAEPGSDAGKERVRLARSLGISEAELGEFLRVVRFELGSRALTTLNEHLSDRLKLAGLKPIPPDHLHSPYDDLARKVLGTGLTCFTSDSLLALLRSEGLFQDPSPHRGQITLRSRPQWAKKPLETQSAHLDLCDLFDERFAGQPDVWSRRIPKALREFITPDRLGDLPQPIEMFFDCHLSIALAAGTLLPPKCGLHLIPVQKSTGKGYEAWECLDPIEPDVWSVIPSEGTSTSEVLVAVSVTHDVIRDPALTVAHRNLGHPPMLAMAPRAGISGRAVCDATHAWSLGAAFPTQLRAYLPPRCARLHLFYAGPAALAFILGAHVGGLPPIQLYEYDFEGTDREDRYYPSLSLPLAHDGE